jgi:hypothetical protein
VPQIRNRLLLVNDFGKSAIRKGPSESINRRQSPDAYRPACADCIAAIRSSMCRVRCGRRLSML